MPREGMAKQEVGVRRYEKMKRKPKSDKMNPPPKKKGGKGHPTEEKGKKERE